MGPIRGEDELDVDVDVGKVHVASKLVLTLKSHPETWEAYFINWTISGELLLGLKSHWHFNFWSKKQLLWEH